jgi:uncharacterized phage protein gp47/JayE
MLIERPNLEIRNEEQLAAQAIARVTGGLDVTLIDAYIAKLQETRKVVALGGLPPAICPELTNANPSAPHTVLLEVFSWLLAQMGYRINQIPEQNLIEFARLFGIELKQATRAETMLRFQTENAVGAVIVPAGTRVGTLDGEVVFETAEGLSIPLGQPTGDVRARNVAVGHTLLAPGTLVNLIDNVAFIASATNPAAIDAGTELESVASALERMRQYQRRTERIVTAKDLEEAILQDAMDGNGIVRAFPFVADGNFDSKRRVVGNTTVIVGTRNGEPVDSITRGKIGALLNQLVGNQFVYIVDPIFVGFNIEATVQLNTNTPQGAVLAVVERNLRNFYDASSRENFGRPILRSEIIAVIEGTPGVDRIVVAPNEPILASPLADLRTRVWELPKLNNVILHLV